MAIWKPAEKPSVLLRRAIADGLVQARGNYTNPEEGTFCALGAIYREFGLTYEELDSYAKRDEAADLLFDGITVDPDGVGDEIPVTDHVIALNDQDGASFKEIADYLETVGL